MTISKKQTERKIRAQEKWITIRKATWQPNIWKFLLMLLCMTFGDTHSINATIIFPSFFYVSFPSLLLCSQFCFGKTCSLFNYHYRRSNLTDDDHQIFIRCSCNNNNEESKKYDTFRVFSDGFTKSIIISNHLNLFLNSFIKLAASVKINLCEKKWTFLH